MAISIKIISLVLCALAVAPTVNAQATDSALNKLDTIGNITGFGDTQTGDAGLYEKIADVINILLGFAGVIASIFIIVAGMRWIMAGGNEEQITKSKDTIKSAVIGIAVVLGAYIVVNFAVTRLIGIFT